MATKTPLDDVIAGAVKAHQKALNRAVETARDLKAALRVGVREKRITQKQADDITRTFAKE